jgi:putative DNA primase/helicase
MSCEILAIADDFQFCEAWRALSIEERAELPGQVRARCIERFRASTRYVDASIERARGVAPRQSDSTDTAPFADAVDLIDGSSVVPEAVPWLWEGYLARGKLHVLAGAPGTGKTMIALSLAAAVSSGKPWPDGRRGNPGRVIIWSAEDDIADVLVPRLNAMGADMNKIGFVGDKFTLNGREPFDPARDMPALMRAVADAGEVKLLIIDPIVCAVAGDSHKNAEVRRGLQPLIHPRNGSWRLGDRVTL